jgi:hypothetical protein
VGFCSIRASKIQASHLVQAGFQAQTETRGTFLSYQIEMHWLVLYQKNALANTYSNIHHQLNQKKTREHKSSAMLLTTFFWKRKRG